MYGPGREKWDELRVQHRTRVSRSTFEGCLELIADPNNMQQVAFGSKNLVLSDGEVITVPAVQRKNLREVMWQQYKERHTIVAEDESGNMVSTYDGVSRAVFFQCAKLTTAGQQKTLAGLDNISFRYGSENFASTRSLVDTLIGLGVGVGIDLSLFGRLKDRIDRYQDFVKTDLVTHLEPHSPVASHCLCRLLGGQSHNYDCKDCEKRRNNPRMKDQCQSCADRAAFSTDCPESCLTHDQHCEMCDQGHVIFASLEEMLSLIKRKATDPNLLPKLEDMNFLIQRCKKRLLKYIGHLVRGKVEADAKATCRASLMPHQVEITMDYKMKWVALLLRECQLEWFGKSGIAWHGAMFIRRLVPDDDGQVDPDDYILDYYDDISNDKKEDGFAVMSCLQADLTTYVRSNSEVTEARVRTDGAGCYSGKYLVHALPLLSSWTGVRILDHGIGEAGMNKSMLDSHFGVA
eukprot:scaffold53397_cov29-Prasinocladus_malaysianus.AAC.1